MDNKEGDKMAEKEYIERDKIGLADFEIIMCRGNYKEALKIFFDKIESMPATDVRPVVRGKWIDEPIKGVRYYCSVCQGRFDYTWHYCPNCGADMRGNNG